MTARLETEALRPGMRGPTVLWAGIGALPVGATYYRRMPRSWSIAMVILVICLIASIVIAATKL